MATFYTTETLSLRKKKTQEGYLVCEAVPVTRTGEFKYYENEIFANGSTAIVSAFRRPQDLFTQETINSFIGKPVTIQHPDEFVNPENYSELAKGTIINCYVGLSEDADKLLCDILITDSEAIRIIEDAEMREVSVGYDTDYVTQPDGTLLQTQIRANHLAIVERGRAGSGCAIRDHQPQELNKMSDNPEKAFLQKLMTAFSAKDSAKEKDPMEEMTDGMASLKSQFDALKEQCDAMQKKLEDMCKPKDAEPVHSAEIDKDLIAAVEIIAPGTPEGAQMADQALATLKAKDAAMVASFEKLPAREAVIACAEIVKRSQVKTVVDSVPKQTKDFSHDFNDKAKAFWGK